MLIFYHHNFHLQLSSCCNWPSSWLHPLHNILSWATFPVLCSSGNFCNISQNIHSKAPVASQHKKTNKVVWTCKDDWPPQRTSTYKGPFIGEGNYVVAILVDLVQWGKHVALRAMKNGQSNDQGFHVGPKWSPQVLAKPLFGIFLYMDASWSIIGALMKSLAWCFVDSLHREGLVKPLRVI